MNTDISDVILSSEKRTNVRNVSVCSYFFKNLQLKFFFIENCFFRNTDEVFNHLIYQRWLSYLVLQIIFFYTWNSPTDSTLLLQTVLSAYTIISSPVTLLKIHSSLLVYKD